MSGEEKRALAAAYRMLARRDHSAYEVRSSLLKKGFSEDAALAAVGALTEKRFLDDRKFSRLYAESLARNKKAGPRYIMQALQKKGIGQNLAQIAVEDLFGGTGREEEEIRRWMGKKYRSYKKELSPLQKKKRLFDFLIRRGFSHSAVMKVINAGRTEE
ncbi:MAG: regulatory protein RecX [Nitrospinae bacterium]|nr:regulatory protein RecX [Nitrospinota bacterium]